MKKLNKKGENKLPRGGTQKKWVKKPIKPYRSSISRRFTKNGRK